MSSRLALLHPVDLDEDQRALYEQITGLPRTNSPFRITHEDGSLAGPFNALLYAPRIGHVVQALGAALRFHGTLPPRMRELVICAVAAALGSDYEWYAHSRVAVTVGVSEAELVDLEAGVIPKESSDAEAAALNLTHELLEGNVISEAVYASAEHQLSSQGITELTILVGYYRTLAGLLAVAAVPAPTGGLLPGTH